MDAKARAKVETRTAGAQMLAEGPAKEPEVTT
jgi:hypothetical protein